MNFVFQRALLGVFAAGVAVSSSLASDVEDLTRMSDQARRIEEQSLTGGSPNWLQSQPPLEDPRIFGLRDNADRIVRDAVLGRSTSEGQGPQQAPPTVAASGRTVVVAASAAMGEAALLDLLREASGADGVVVVFRGVQPGERISDAIQRIQKLVSKIEPTPSVQIDPTVFSKHGVSQAPEVLIFDDGVLSARARGLVVAEPLLRRLRDGEGGDFGVMGPVVDISEPDLIEVMQARAAQIDLAAAKQRAFESYWQRAPLVELGTVTEERVRRVDGTTMVTRDVRTPDGRLVAAAGTRINPFNVLPFTLRVVVFDARDGRQVETARRLVQETPAGRRPMVLLSGFDRNTGWDGFDSLQQRLGVPVYLLTQEIRSRVKLERVPAVIEMAEDGKAFSVREVLPR
jgi:conjugal transfer pilus assembly protein TraW